MFKKLYQFLKKFRAGKTISDDLHEKNRNILEKIYIFSIVFGIFGLVYTNFTPSGLTKMTLFYYSYYYFAGIIGLIFCCTNSGKYTPGAFALISFYVIFIFFVANKSLIESLVFFLGFALVIEILLNLNPLVYVSCLLFSEVLLFTLILLNVIHGRDEVKGITLANLMLVNIIAVYLAFWKRGIILRKYYTESQIEAERKKSEGLLLNVLPQNIVEQLQKSGKAEPEIYENVTVLFCEFLNFKDLSSVFEPEVLVNELNCIYDLFDEIVEKNCCLRIKTFGEIYMTVCGLPLENPLHAEHIMDCAEEFLATVKKRNESSEVKFEVKLGVSSGSVIAGIVGIKKYIYDVFGDTVNIAFRMKTLCSSMKIKVSPETYELVGSKYDFVKRTPIEVKGKGLMETYDCE